jgi:hypothetical protein
MIGAMIAITSLSIFVIAFSAPVEGALLFVVGIPISFMTASGKWWMMAGFFVGLSIFFFAIELIMFEV